MHISDVVWASGISAGITAAALVLVTLFNNNREQTRLAAEGAERQKDRDHQATEALTARGQAVEDHWRDERLQAHAAYLAAVERLRREVDDVTRSARLFLPRPPTSSEDRDALRDAWSRVQMLGSREAVEKGGGLYFRCQVMQGYIANAPPDWEASDDATRRRDGLVIDIDRNLADLNNFLSAYLSAARRDIGTES